MNTLNLSSCHIRASYRHLPAHKIKPNHLITSAREKFFVATDVDILHKNIHFYTLKRDGKITVPLAVLDLHVIDNIVESAINEEPASERLAAALRGDSSAANLDAALDTLEDDEPLEQVDFAEAEVRVLASLSDVELEALKEHAQHISDLRTAEEIDLTAALRGSGDAI